MDGATRRDASTERLEARLEEAQIARFKRHAQSPHRTPLDVDLADGFGHDIHVRLGIDTPGNRETHEFQGTETLWSLM